METTDYHYYCKLSDYFNISVAEFAEQDQDLIKKIVHAWHDDEIGEVHQLGYYLR